MYLTYVIVAGEDQYCKVGFSQLTKLRERVSDLQVGCPLKLYLLGFRVAPEKWIATREELAFHHRFRSARLCGEWFDFKNKYVKKAVCSLVQISGARLQQTIDSHSKEFRSLI